MSPDQVSKIKTLARDVAQREGCVLYDLEFLDKGPRILRIYIERETPGATGVSLEDCVNVSRGMNLALDVEDIIPGGRYELEVSSPGLERKLNEPWHYQKAIGKDVQVKFTTADGTNKTVKGKLVSSSDQGFEIEASGKTESVRFENVLKAKMIFVVPEKKGPQKNKKR